ncbi:MAG: phosphoribosylformylglycinamidine synthase subunit PurQ [Planctomycetota bacterium]|nr:phosphoribosylformylglycinamidine synthase subunit PurQ [Planctomycetota bacterium]
MPRALVVRAAGTNCDLELCRAFALGGAEVDLAHVDAIARDPSLVERAHLIGFPGGFSYGDDIASGRILAMRVREKLYGPLREAMERGAIVIGVCNGFQVMVQAGLLPGPGVGERWPPDASPRPRLSLVDNTDARFTDRWVGVEVEPDTCCAWAKDAFTLPDEVWARDVAMLPVAHGEGRLVTESAATLGELERRGQVVLRYRDNYNGSAGRVAGVCDASGRVFALMPHPERYLDWTRHPYWTRLSPSARAGQTPGARLFRNAVEAAMGRTDFVRETGTVAVR